MIRTALLAFLACLVAACGQAEDREDSTTESANPLLWEIARADGPDAGKVEGWLLGTIHALPDNASWRSESIDRVISDADLLAVEVADMGDGRAMASAFLPLAFSAGQPPLTTRVPVDQRSRLAELVEDSSYRLEDFSRIESWGAALILAQTVRTDTDITNGIDRELIGDFGRRQIVELEGARAQFLAFDGLSEKAQRAMLAGIVEESEAELAYRMRPVTLYLAGDAVGLEQLTHDGMLANEEIREALLTRRNARWIAPIEALLADNPQALIAVGAAHMVGDDGLVALLRAKGYTVRRLD